jgi:hypothetical protein
MAFKPGQSGNPGGRRKVGQEKPSLKQELIRELQRDRERLRKIAIKLIEAAEGGDMAAIVRIGDVLDGKPTQETTLRGDAGAPITLVLNGTDVRG